MLSIKILTPEKTVFSGDISGITVRTVIGDVGILENHANYRAVLKSGDGTLYEGDTLRKITHGEGIISVENNSVTVLVRNCEIK